MPFSLPDDLRVKLLHFLGIGVTLSAAKVVLYTLAAGIFFAREGPDQLPLFYLLFAVFAVIVSSAFSAVVDALPQLVLIRTTILASAVVGLVVRLLVASDAPYVYFLLLAGAHIYEIISDIIFWVAAAGFFTSRELKRCSGYFFMAWAGGGAAGGLLANTLLSYFIAEDLIFAFLVLILIGLIQVSIANRRLDEIEDDQEDEDEEGGLLANARLLPKFVADYPFVMLLACNVLVLMLLYCLCEYLWATVYVSALPDEAELASFVARVYFAAQLVEFTLLAIVNQPLLERTGPMVRNLVFPLTSLGCLIAFAFSPKLLAAVAMQINSEAISNAVFEPVNKANYVALPYRLQGRVRTLVDGIFYSMGMAAAGLALMWGGAEPETFPAMIFAAVVAALLFFALNVGLGSLFLPTLVRTMRSGIVHFAEVAERLEPPRLTASELRPFILSSDPSTRAIGFAALKEQLDPTPMLDDLQMVAARADRESRTQLVGVLRGMPRLLAERFASRLLNGHEPGGQLVALFYLLGNPRPSESVRLRALSEAPREAVAVLARLVLASDDPAAITRLCADLRAGEQLDAEAHAVLIDALASAGRAELTPLLVVLIELGFPEETEKALVTLGRIADPTDTAAAACSRRFVLHHDHRIRAAAVGALGAFEPERDVAATLDRGLEDPNASVRRRATEALARHGDAAVEIASARLADSDVRVVKAALRILGRIGSRRARLVLEGFLEERSALGVHHLTWLGQLPPSQDDLRFRALRFVLEESNRRTVDLALETLAALGEERIIDHIRRVFSGDDRRRRADAVEALLALRHRHLVIVLLPLLDAFVRSTESRQEDGAGRMTEQLIEAAARDPDSWVRAAARLARDRSVPSPGRKTGGETFVPTLAVAPAPAGSAHVTVEVTEAQVERILFLKSLPLFRHLPLDTLRAVAEVLRQRHFMPGEEIVRAGTSLAELFILESGVVAVKDEDGKVERLTAPALFGEQSMVEDLVWSRTVEAIEPCALLTVHRTVFQDLANDYPDIVVELSRLLARRREDHPAVADKPSLAVLPFKNMSGDPEQEYFADGISEDIITALSKYRVFLVIARNSSFAFRGGDHDLKRVAGALGARYVVEGTVRRSGDRVRITARLVDAAAGHQIWTERYDRELGDIFAVQDEITDHIAAAVAPEFLSAEATRAKRKNVRDLDTWEYVMRASWHHARCSQRDFAEAHALLERALALDPLNVGGLCLEAFTHLAEIQFGWTESPQDSLKAATRASRAAVDLDARDALARTAVGFVDLMSRRYDDAIGRLEHAVSLNPNLAIAQGGLGQAYALSGDYERAVAQIEKAIRLSPEDPFMIYWFGHLGLGAYAARRYDEAADWGAKAVRHNPDSPAGHRLLAASLAQLGRTEEARTELQELLQKMPGMTADDVRRQVPFRRPEDIELYIEGLRKAGLAE